MYISSYLESFKLVNLPCDYLSMYTNYIWYNLKRSYNHSLTCDILKIENELSINIPCATSLTL